MLFLFFLHVKLKRYFSECAGRRPRLAGCPDLSSPVGWKRRRGGGEGRRLRWSPTLPGADPVFPRVDPARRGADPARSEPNRRRSSAAARGFLYRRRRSTLGATPVGTGGALREGGDGGRAARGSAGRASDRGGRWLERLGRTPRRGDCVSWEARCTSRIASNTVFYRVVPSSPLQVISR